MPADLRGGRVLPDREGSAVIGVNVGPGVNGIATDAILSPLQRHLAHEHDQRGLARRIGAQAAAWMRSEIDAGLQRIIPLNHEQRVSSFPKPCRTPY